MSGMFADKADRLQEWQSINFSSLKSAHQQTTIYEMAMHHIFNATIRLQTGAFWIDELESCCLSDGSKCYDRFYRAMPPRVCSHRISVGAF
jgi:hypothetical protein